MQFFHRLSKIRRRFFIEHLPFGLCPGVGFFIAVLPPGSWNSCRCRRRWWYGPKGGCRSVPRPLLSALSAGYPHCSAEHCRRGGYGRGWYGRRRKGGPWYRSPAGTSGWCLQSLSIKRTVREPGIRCPARACSRILLPVHSGAGICSSSLLSFRGGPSLPGSGWSPFPLRVRHRQNRIVWYHRGWFP